jgi:ATP synthase protein I
MFNRLRLRRTPVLQRLALAQVVLAPVAAGIAAVTNGSDAAVAVLYGMLVAVAASALLAWREHRAAQHPEWDERRLYGLLVRTAIERLLLLVGLLAFGFGVLRLAPLPLLTGLVVAQLGWFAALGGGR